MSSQGRIGWYCPRERRYVEISLSGAVKDIQVSLPMGTTEVTAIALTDSGDTFFSTTSGSPGQWTVSILDPSSRTLLPIYSGPGFGALFGANGNTLVGSTNNSSLSFFEFVK